MPFNELNSVEHFVIHRLSGVNLNQVKGGQVAEAAAPYGYTWEYVPAETLGRELTEVLLEKELKQSLIRLNPSIHQNPDYADEVIRKLRSILITVSNVGLVRANAP